MSFENFGLAPELLRAVNELGHDTPTPIQHKAIPIVLGGHDAMALAQTGTGKTGAFTLPVLHLLNANPKPSSNVRALILTPTRELAAQVGESVKNYGRYLSLQAEVIFGGVNITPQIRRLQRGADIIVATPGRLLDLVDQRVVSLSKVEILVLDEADRMLDMGFIRDIKKILSLLPKQRQNMLFSATLSAEIQSLAAGILNNHKLIEVASRNATTELVDQLVYQVDQKQKRALLSYIIGSNNWQQVLVFTRTKHNANKLCEQLIEDGLKSAALHGNKSQGARTRALEDFKTGKIRVLVATDIAARGIDIVHLPHVVNYELPNVPEDYVHRIGRTGRAGQSGNAISLVCASENKLLLDIEKLTKRTIARKIMPGYEPDPNSRAMPCDDRANYSRRSQAPRNRSEQGSRAPRSSARPSTGNNWRSAAKPTDGNRLGTWRSDPKPTSGATDGDRRSNRRGGSKPATSATAANKRSDWRAGAKPAGRRTGNTRFEQR